MPINIVDRHLLKHLHLNVPIKTTINVYLNNLVAKRREIEKDSRERETTNDLNTKYRKKNTFIDINQSYNPS